MSFTNSYSEPWKPAYEEMPSRLEGEYRDFKIHKQMELNLYSIVAPDGKKIHPSLDGAYTKMELLKGQIDKFLSEYGTIHAAFTDIDPPRRGRGRPHKNRTPLEQLQRM